MLTGGKLEQEALGEKEKGLRWWEWCQESLSGSVSALYLVQCLAPSCHQPGVFPLYWVLSYIHYFIYSSSQLYGAFCSPLGPSTTVFALRLPSLDGHLWLPFSSIFLLDKGMCLSGTLPLSRLCSRSLTLWYSLSKWLWSHFPGQCRLHSQG